MLRFPRLDRRDKQKLPNKSGTLTEVLHEILRETLLKNGFPQTFFLKLLSLNFASDRALHTSHKWQVFSESALSGAKFQFKVFGRGDGGEPFLRKVSPDNYI